MLAGYSSMSGRSFNVLNAFTSQQALTLYSFFWCTGYARGEGAYAISFILIEANGLPFRAIAVAIKCVQKPLNALSRGEWLLDTL